MILGDFLRKKIQTFSTKIDVFDFKTSFLPLRMLIITKIKLKIAIKLENTGVYSDFPAFWGDIKNDMGPAQWWLQRSLSV